MFIGLWTLKPLPQKGRGIGSFVEDLHLIDIAFYQRWLKQVMVNLDSNEPVDDADPVALPGSLAEYGFTAKVQKVYGCLHATVLKQSVPYFSFAVARRNRDRVKLLTMVLAPRHGISSRVIEAPWAPWLGLINHLPVEDQSMAAELDEFRRNLAWAFVHKKLDSFIEVSSLRQLAI